MSVKQRHRVGHGAQVMLATGVALSCGLTGCAQATGVSAHAIRLSASQDSDLLDASARQRYEVTEMALASAQTLNGFTLPTTVIPSGYFVAQDGIISEAWLEASFGDDQEVQAHASFQLTEPTVLRPNYDSTDTENSDSAGSVTAVGTLLLGGVERADTKVQFTVVELSDTGAELDVLLSAPADLLTVSNGPASVAAHISFDAN